MRPRPMTLSVEALLVHADFVRALARSLLADPSAADDVVQDTWLAALRTPPRELSRSWLATVVRNFARQRVRVDGRRHAREQRGARTERIASVDEIAEREATRAELVRAVLALPEPSRSAVLMRFYDGRSVQEIARLTRAPVETVRTRIKRGLAHLRADLDQSYPNAWTGLLVPLAATSVGGKTTSVAAAGALKLWIAASVVAMASVAWWTTRGGPEPAPTETAAATALAAPESSVVLDEEREPVRAPATVARVREVAIAGSVVDPRGAPVEGAVVYVSKSGPPPDGQEYFEGIERELRRRRIDVELARTDASGQFAHRATSGERVFVAVLGVRNPSLRRKLDDVREITAPAADLRFVLDYAPTATIEVRVVVGLRGLAVSDFACTFLRVSDRRVFHAKAQGSLLAFDVPLTDALEDEFIVSVEGREHGSTSKRVRVAPSEHVRVLLRYPSSPSLRGVVVDEHGDPIPGALVRASTQRELRGEQLFQPIVAERIRHGAAATDASGTFVLRASDTCITAWHEQFSPVTVPLGEATRIVMPPRRELRVRLLDDAAESWQGTTVRLDRAREATTDSDGLAVFDRVESGVRGLFLADGRIISLVVDARPVQEFTIGPWLERVSIRTRAIVERVRSGKEATLVGVAGAASLLMLRATPEEIVLDRVLPGSYLLVTDTGYFARLEIDARGEVREFDERGRAPLAVDAPAGSRVFIAPADANELVRLVCERMTGRDAAGTGLVRWGDLPVGSWSVALENQCTSEIVAVDGAGTSATIR